EGLQVVARAELPGYRADERSGTSDGSGRVELQICDGLEYLVRLHEPGLGIPLLTVPAPRSGDEPWVLRVPDEARASAFVEGVLLDAEGRPAIDGCHIAVHCRDRIAYPGSSMAPAVVDAALGRFRLGPLPPGSC